jgi:spermidine synthase
MMQSAVVVVEMVGAVVALAEKSLRHADNGFDRNAGR